MKCENCGTDTGNGNHYVFHYGKQMGQMSTSKGATTVTKTDYKIAGSDHVFFCNKCVVTKYGQDQSQIGFAIVSLPTLLGLSLLLQVGFEDATIQLYLLCLVVPAAIGLFKGLPYLVRWRKIQKAAQNNDDIFFLNVIEQEKKTIEDIGDKWAIDKREPNLSKLGYDGFFTRSKYRELEFK